MRLKYVDASERFLALLKGVTDPETKAKIDRQRIHQSISEGDEKMLEDQRDGDRKHSGYTFLTQGTLYPDVIESVSIGGNPPR